MITKSRLVILSFFAIFCKDSGLFCRYLSEITSVLEKDRSLPNAMFLAVQGYFSDGKPAIP